MKRAEQKRFVKTLCGSVASEIISKIESGKIPENWDGWEFREILKEKFTAEAHISSESAGHSARHKEYKNTVIVNNL
jgi:hypothetical protein